MNNPRITIMIPVHNMAATIERAIDSVLSQNYVNKELMVFDAMSSDGTLEIVRKYGSQIDFVSSQKDNGPSDAMAKNLSHATGNYITMLGADDYYEENALEAIARTIEETDADVVYGDCNFKYMDGRNVRKCAKMRGLQNLYFYNSIFTNAAAVRKELLLDYYGNEWDAVQSEVSISTDHYLWLLLYHRKKKFAYIESKCALTNYAVSGRSARNEFEGCLDDLTIFNLVIGKDKESRAIYEPRLLRYVAARSVCFYEQVIGIEAFRNEVQKYVMPDKDYIIFGTGDMSGKALRLLSIVGIMPAYFVDNNAGRGNNTYLSYKVHLPEVLSTELDKVVLIAVNGNEQIIRNQLKEMKLDVSVSIVDYAQIAWNIQKTLGLDMLEDAWRRGKIK